ncbi:tau-cadinol synthase-like [Aegilops tauschii subsp. strangulata]|uniref:tau-cadinol synthase-like n=1 Tax=Aegilops tauschii subsp. strangulata TaxID=200361 RepID=UPI001ABCD4BD|nr:tau-cadinol synthase-like [Aegilops tauschii subsp. strangulata]
MHKPSLEIHTYIYMASITREMVCGFEPSVWGDYFITYQPPPLQRSEVSLRIRAKKLTEDVCMLLNTCKDGLEKITLVDSLQHLGIDHLFAEQIRTSLWDIHGTEFSSSSLHYVALRFRLLREHGIWVSTDVFNNFRGKDGCFKKDITNEPKGLLSLYNAAYLFVHNEPELEEAISFARHHLEVIRGSLNSPLAEQVKRALQVPLPRTSRRVETLHYLSEYKKEKDYKPLMLELAQLDFTLLRHVQLMELKDISEWWNNLKSICGLTYVCDRIVEAYLWSHTVFYEQSCARARMIKAKLITLITILDDTYDVHAIIEECRLLNAAIQRWDESAISDVPEYLKIFYRELLRNFQMFEGEEAIVDKYRIDYMKKAFQNQSAYYLQEAEWVQQNHKPCFEDQVNLTSMSSAVPLLSVGMLAGMGEAITNAAFDWVSSRPDAVIAGAKIGRFLNDITAYKRGKNRGDVESSVECYIHEHGVTDEQAFAVIYSLIEDGWKTTNQARFDHGALLPAVQRVVNAVVSMQLYYDNGGDAYTFNMHIQEIVNKLFLKPIPM